MAVHTLFDVLAWVSATAMGVWLAHTGWLPKTLRRTPFTDPFYFIALSAGAVAGALAFGSLNLDLAGRFVPGHSIAGALIGGTAAIEAFKWQQGVRISTGTGFVAPLAIGIAVGRWGCFFAGLPDYTYGTPTALPWGVDFGDGIYRHPVQLYESAAMLAFLAVYLREIARGSPLFLRQGFYLFIGWYGLQRFVWEFLKPYSKLVGPFNLFHGLCFLMVAYGIFMMRHRRELRPAV